MRVVLVVVVAAPVVASVVAPLWGREKSALG